MSQRNVCCIRDAWEASKSRGNAMVGVCRRAPPAWGGGGHWSTVGKNNRACLFPAGELASGCDSEAARTMTRGPVRNGNASAFYGDRFSAVREMLTGGPLDVLTGDYLAELTMLILGRDRMKDPRAGFAKTFYRQMEESLALAIEKRVKIVVNAGGLAPAG